jgi:hypothetical protein
MPDNAKEVKLMRVTIREDFSIGMADIVSAGATLCLLGMPALWD